MAETVGGLSERMEKQLDKIEAAIAKCDTDIKNGQAKLTADVQDVQGKMNFIRGAAATLVVIAGIMGAVTVTKFYSLSDKVASLDADSVRKDQLVEIKTGLAKIEGALQLRVYGSGSSSSRDCEIRNGKILSVSATRITIQTGPPRRRTLSFKITEQTKIYVDDNEGKVTDLKKGMYVVVTEEEQGIAAEINDLPAPDEDEEKPKEKEMKKANGC